MADAEAAQGRDLLPLIDEAVSAGVTLIQLRGKKLQTREFLKKALESAALLKTKMIPLIINDRIDIALACGADGVHLGQDDLPVPYARKLLGPEKIIGISAGSVDEALHAETEGADYLGVGPIFHTLSKEGIEEVIGIEGLKTVKARTKIPILAIGGIKVEHIHDVISAGAEGIAVISAILGAEDILGATHDLAQAVAEAKRQ